MTLADDLARLDAWLRRKPDVPTWSRHLLVESRDVRYGPVDEIPRTALRTVEEYAATFEGLLAAGYSWINVSALGVDGDALITCVELPRDAVGVPPGRTSVNLSGPPLDVAGRPVWGIGARVRIVVAIAGS